VAAPTFGLPAASSLQLEPDAPLANTGSVTPEPGQVAVSSASTGTDFVTLACHPVAEPDPSETWRQLKAEAAASWLYRQRAPPGWSPVSSAAAAGSVGAVAGSVRGAASAWEGLRFAMWLEQATAGPEESSQEEDGSDSGSTVDGFSRCVVCLSDAATVALLPCGHVCVCDSCCGRVGACPICRQDVETLYQFSRSWLVGKE
jgi:hypothetical protein